MNQFFSLPDKKKLNADKISGLTQGVQLPQKWSAKLIAKTPRRSRGALCRICVSLIVNLKEVLYKIHVGISRYLTHFLIRGWQHYNVLLNCQTSCMSILFVNNNQSTLTIHCNASSLNEMLAGGGCALLLYF